MMDTEMRCCFGLGSPNGLSLRSFIVFSCMTYVV
uniref:Uncharacterized protein n=1 Tax=Arundo donax TaxID=35708 RepID=A0A0A9G1L1_ARUDO